MTAPRRRWSFGLRTLLVVVTTAGGPLAWVGYSLNWIRERERILDRFPTGLSPYIDLTGTPPLSLRPFGATGVRAFWLPKASEDRRAKLHRLFPEAEIDCAELSSSSPATQP